MGGVLSVKKWKMEVYGVVKKWTFPQCRVHYVQYQFFILHYTYLGGGCVHTQRTPTAYGLVQTDNIIPTPGIFDDKKISNLGKKSKQHQRARIARIRNGAKNFCSFR